LRVECGGVSLTTSGRNASLPRQPRSAGEVSCFTDFAFQPLEGSHGLTPSDTRHNLLSITWNTMKATRETTELLGDWVMSGIDHSTQDPNVGFVETLYQTCSTALIHLWRSRFRLTSHGPHKNTLKKDVANIRLWEENFPPGYLDTILGQSDHLKTNVIENLKGIGNILMLYFAGCEGAAISPQNESNSTRDIVLELETQLEKAAIMLSAEERSESSSDDEEFDDSPSTTEREQNRYGRLHCYVSCLMDLTPVIEKHISRLQHKVEPPPTPLENVFRLSQSAQPFAMRIRDRLVFPQVFPLLS
jgi:hypothetical protein